MDEEMSGELTRPPDEHDLITLARELNRLEARYVVIGGIAINRLGFVRATQDLDLLIAQDRDNQQRIRKALEVLPDKAVRELGPDEDFSSWVVVRINDEITVDIMTEASGIQFEEAADEIEWDERSGVRIPFASAKLMLRFKQGSVREKDVMDRKFLEQRSSDHPK
jgi:hypothetical protein